MLIRALLLALVSCLLGCPPIMLEHDGRLLFNPTYLFLLDGSPRESWQESDAVFEALELTPDSIVADIGAGGGYFTERFSRFLERGHVFATDVQDEMLERLTQRIREEDLGNVTVVRGAFDAPVLPEGCCDLVFLSSVYKEIEDRVAYMREVRRLLRPGGRVAILEFRPGALGPGPPPDLRLAEDQITAELDAAGFELLESHDFVPPQSYQIFGVRQRTAANPSAS